MATGGATTLWWERRRLRRLEGELASAKADQLELRQRLEVFEAIASAAGAALPESSWWGRIVPEAPMPPSLLAAATDYTNPDATVRLDVDGTDVIAIIGGPGDPREWWSAVWSLTVSGVAS
jgi:hypothetical protein